MTNDLLKKDEKYKLILIGSGEEEEACKEQVSNLGLDQRVIFYGLSSNVNDLLQAMDAFVLPSKYEGFPLVIVEAQASDLSCFVSNNVSNEVKLTDKLSFFDLEELGFISEQIHAFSNLPDLRNDLTSYNTLKNSEFDNGALHQILDELYEM